MTLKERISINPYRQLGVYVGSPISLEMRNKARIAAYSRVGQTVSFSFPVDNLLSPINRTEESAEAALRTLALPEDRVRNALLWIGEGRSEWSISLNTAVNALLNEDYLKAIQYYDRLIYDDRQREEFLDATTSGLLTVSIDDLVGIIYDVLVEQSVDFVELFTTADANIGSNHIAGMLFQKHVMPVIDNILSFNDVFLFFSDVPHSIAYFRAKIDKMFKLLCVMACFWGKDSVQYEDISVQILSSIYEKATEFISMIGHKVWIYDKKTLYNDKLAEYKSDKSIKVIKYYMYYVSQIIELVNDASARMSLNENSMTIISPLKFKFEETYEEIYVTDEYTYLKATQSHRIKSIVSDVVWLALVVFSLYISFKLD